MLPLGDVSLTSEKGFSGASEAFSIISMSFHTISSILWNVQWNQRFLPWQGFELGLPATEVDDTPMCHRYSSCDLTCTKLSKKLHRLSPPSPSLSLFRSLYSLFLSLFLFLKNLSLTNFSFSLSLSLSIVLSFSLLFSLSLSLSLFVSLSISIYLYLYYLFLFLKKCHAFNNNHSWGQNMRWRKK